MENFVFLNPTKVIFGKDTELQVGKEVKAYSSKILLHYGSGSVIKSGLLNKVKESLKNEGVSFIELGGVKPNPRVSLVREGIKICRENNISFILAVGGGSVIDSSKAISVGVPYNGDVWDFYDYKTQPKESLKVASVLTIPAAGSETSQSSVITNEELKLKRGLTNDLLFPVFTIMDPVLTFTLPQYQTACGASDIMAHIMERYFTNTKNVELTDRLCEAALKTIMHNAPLAIKDPSNYDARAEIMFTGTVAHNNLLGMGRVEDWGSHSIEHEISAIYDVAHGAGLSVVFPAWIKYVYKTNPDRFLQFASRVFGIDVNYYNKEQTILDAVACLEKFYKSIGLPTRLSDMNITDKDLQEMAQKATFDNKNTVGNFVKLTAKDVLEILKLAL
ncbi:MAG: iron-containing alcohol dehydrogenase [Fibrobacter sp.]|nr:iron-containing alcohol dehydrogenase [Fibrobacter sp.]